MTVQTIFTSPLANAVIGGAGILAAILGTLALLDRPAQNVGEATATGGVVGAWTGLLIYVVDYLLTHSLSVHALAIVSHR